MKPIVVKELRLWNEFENYEIHEVVGTGGWGKVYSAVRRSDNKPVALKFFGYTSQSPVISSINSEVMLMMSLIGVHGALTLSPLPELTLYSGRRCCTNGIIILRYT
jgi:serine/threonine protein kinase